MKRERHADLRPRARQSTAAVKVPGHWDQAKVIAALKERMTQGVELNTDAVARSDSRLSNAIYRCFGSHGAALSAIGIDPAAVRKHQSWDKPKIVAALRERHAQGKAINATAVEKSDCPLKHAIRRYFGRHDTALKAAGFDPPPRPRLRRWNKTKIVAALKKRIAGGLAMHGSAIYKSDRSLNSAIEHHFGSHREGLRAVGLDPEAVRNSRLLDKDQALARLRERLAMNLPLNYGAIHRSDDLLRSAIRRHFATHDDALRAIGVDPATVRRHVSWDKPKIVAALHERHARGLGISAQDVSCTDSKLWKAIGRYFGQYDAGLRAAGFDPQAVRRRGYNRDKHDVIAALRGLARDGVVSWTMVTAADPSLNSAARRVFGSVRAAAVAARLEYDHGCRDGPAASHWTEEVVLQTLRDLHKDGQDLRYRRVKEHRQPLFFAAKQLFGSYVNAVRQAGINYWGMSQEQLAKEREDVKT